MNSPLKNISSLARYAASSFMLLALFGVLPGLAQASACHACGTIVSVHTCQQPAAHGSGVGMVTDAVVGGLLGNQVGGGNGRTFATAAGAVGGGYAVNAIKKRVRSYTVTRVRVRMNNGSVRTFTEAGNSRWVPGERVQGASWCADTRLRKRHKHHAGC